MHESTVLNLQIIPHQRSRPTLLNEKKGELVAMVAKLMAILLH